MLVVRHSRLAEILRETFSRKDLLLNPLANPIDFYLVFEVRFYPCSCAWLNGTSQI